MPIRYLKSVKFDNGHSFCNCEFVTRPGVNDLDHEVIRFSVWQSSHYDAVQFCKSWEIIPANDCYGVLKTGVSYRNDAKAYRATIYLYANVGKYSSINCL